ncbi:MAG: DUF211 domain-containing protein [SAR86 cluster bacterium]|jgi:uncharacterized protein|uniref:DUF211 domain-containing protein n=1 Tax=SAR86 cluster bacterium TaxID=2030880 RepID=A0A972VYU3_9GAMM|nr:DUF211 domain-containing protein [SAR86 cluster bacterium]
MVLLKRLVLDILKPHSPNSLDFCATLAAAAVDMQVSCRVIAVDAKTESVEVCIEGAELHFDQIEASIRAQGASLHSIDEVEVVSLVDQNS